MSYRRIAIVEDDAEIVSLIESAVISDGFDCQSFRSICCFKAAGSLPKADVYLLDVVLPDGNGFELIRQVRTERPDVGIIMITGCDDEVDSVLALELGADDYVTKPFRLRELRARIGALLRRLQQPRNFNGTNEGLNGQHSFQVGGLHINVATRNVRTTDGKSVELTTTEYDVLHILMTRPNKVLSREAIMDKVRGPDWAAYDRTVDGIISRVRSKLTKLSIRDVEIKTIRGIGYMLTCE